MGPTAWNILLETDGYTSSSKNEQNCSFKIETWEQELEQQCPTSLLPSHPTARTPDVEERFSFLFWLRGIKAESRAFMLTSNSCLQHWNHSETRRARTQASSSSKSPKPLGPTSRMLFQQFSNPLCRGRLGKTLLPSASSSQHAYLDTGPRTLCLLKTGGLHLPNHTRGRFPHSGYSRY